MPRLRTEKRRDQLLELGVGLFANRAYDDVSIGDIAEAAGVSKGLLYHYFGSKRAYYVAVVDVAATQLVEAVTLRADADPAGRARRGIHAYLDFVERRRDAFRALMRGGLGADPEVEAITDRTRRAFVDRMVGYLGLERPPPGVRNAARAWIGAVEAASLDWLDHGDPGREEMIDALVAGLVGCVGTALVAAPEVPLDRAAVDQLFADP
jgi:AcrR family transcriptional regulator